MFTATNSWPQTQSLLSINVKSLKEMETKIWNGERLKGSVCDICNAKAVINI
jgi:hypothetical protein